jgi:hypothetical protein
MATINNKFEDDVVVSLSELAEAMRTSRWTVRRWMEKGYKFQYGNRTTPGHCRKWLEEHANDLKRKELSNEDVERQRILLARLRETKRKQKSAKVSSKRQSLVMKSE